MRYELDFVIEALKKAKRLGSDVDMPEGSRYIMLSETLVNKMISEIENQKKQMMTILKDLSSVEMDLNKLR